MLELHYIVLRMIVVLTHEKERRGEHVVFQPTLGGLPGSFRATRDYVVGDGESTDKGYHVRV
jgi:hypothetical protein